MDRIRTITHKGKSIIYCDFSGFNIFSKDGLQEIMAQAKAFIAKQPLGSVLILTNATKLNFDTEIIKMFMDYTAHNKPYIKASAVIGVAGLLNIALNSVIKNVLRDIHTFDTEALALDWLVEQ